MFLTATGVTKTQNFYAEIFFFVKSVGHWELCSPFSQEWMLRNFHARAHRSSRRRRRAATDGGATVLLLPVRLHRALAQLLLVEHASPEPRRRRVGVLGDGVAGEGTPLVARVRARRGRALPRVGAGAAAQPVHLDRARAGRGTDADLAERCCRGSAPLRSQKMIVRPRKETAPLLSQAGTAAEVGGFSSEFVRFAYISRGKCDGAQRAVIPGLTGKPNEKRHARTLSATRFFQVILTFLYRKTCIFSCNYHAWYPWRVYDDPT